MEKQKLSLEEVQNTFTRSLLKSRPELAVPSFVRDGGAFTKEMRFEVYHYAFWARLLECLEDDFPLLQKHLGKKQFRKMIAAYIEWNGASHASIGEVGRELPRFLKIRSPWNSKPALSDLALLEWLKLAAFLAPPPPHLLNLAGLTEADIGLKCHASTFLMASSGKRKTYHLIARGPKGVFSEKISEKQYRLLRRLENGCALGSLARYLDRHTEFDADHVFAWVSQWVSQQVLHHFLFRKRSIDTEPAPVRISKSKITK